MNWRHLYPEGSTVFVGGKRYYAFHNAHLEAIDLYSTDGERDGELAMTIAVEFVPRIASGVKYPTT